jgi:predicted DNA binding CopG/RHH family protein
LIIALDRVHTEVHTNLGHTDGLEMEEKRLNVRKKSKTGHPQSMQRHTTRSNTRLKDFDVDIEHARTEQIAIRLHARDLEALLRVASAKGIGHTTLARSVLEQWLATVRGRRRVARGTRTRRGPRR